MKIFSPDSGFIQALSRIADMMFVNVVFLIACIPVFTFGPAKTALYDCAVKWVNKEDAGIVDFFRAFKANFRSGILPGILMFIVTLLLYFDFMLSFAADELRILRVVAIILMVVFFPYCEQVFIFLARFECGFKDLMRNALIMFLTNPIRNVLCAVLMYVPLVIFMCAPEVFIKFTMLWLLGYFSLAALLSARLLKKPQEAIISIHENQVKENNHDNIGFGG